MNRRRKFIVALGAGVLASRSGHSLNQKTKFGGSGFFQEERAGLTRPPMRSCKVCANSGMSKEKTF